MEEFLKVIACRESVLDDEDFETFDGGNFDDTLKGKPEIYYRERNKPISLNDKIIYPNPLKWQEWQKILARCYAHISMVDAAGGLILDKLDELGLAENTLVIWAADHGERQPVGGRAPP